MASHRRHHSGVFLVRCVSRRSTAPADRRRLVPHKRAPGKDVCLSALQKRELRHHPALGRLRHAETSCELNTIKRQGAAWLAVKPQEVIPGQTESADRWLACEANMRPVPVVTMEPSGQRGISLL